MGRVVLGSLAGMLAGVGIVAGLLPATVWVVRLAITPILQVEHWVFYVSVVLGAAAGALCGALAGTAAAVMRALRESPPRGQQ
jgi:hypothetical protein